MRGLQSAHSSSSLLLFPPHAFPCSSVGPSHGKHLPHRGLSRGCRGISAGAPGAPPALLLLSPRGSQGCFSPCFPQTALAAGQRFALSYPGFPRGARPWLRGSAVPCGGAAGAGWNRLCPARGSPGRFSQGPPLQPSLPAPTPSTRCNLYGLGHSGGK